MAYFPNPEIPVIVVHSECLLKMVVQLEVFTFYPELYIQIFFINFTLIF